MWCLQEQFSCSCLTFLQMVWVPPTAPRELALHCRGALRPQAPCGGTEVPSSPQLWAWSVLLPPARELTGLTQAVCDWRHSWSVAAMFSYRRAFHTTAVCGGVAQKTPARRLGVLHPSMRVLQPKGGSDVSGHGTMLHAQDRHGAKKLDLSFICNCIWIQMEVHAFLFSNHSLSNGEHFALFHCHILLNK